jgi:hypothetical protein
MASSPALSGFARPAKGGIRASEKGGCKQQSGAETIFRAAHRL